MRTQLLVALLAGCTVLCGGTSRADTAADTAADARNAEIAEGMAQGPYCGVYSLYGALTLLDYNVDFEELLDPRYIGSYSGSSAEELRRAAEHYGARAVPMKRLTAAALRECPHPVLLHFSSRHRPTVYDHWVLYLGADESGARIVDPPNDRATLSFAEVLSRWDGSGIAVSRGEEAATAGWRTALWSAPLPFAVGLGAVALLVGWERRRRRPRAHPSRLRGSLRESFALLAAALLVAVPFHALQGEGLFRNARAVALIKEAHYPTAFAEIGIEELQAEMERGAVAVLDARFPSSYALGGIPGAINLPFTAGTQLRRAVLDGIPKDSAIVLYCQSEGCGFDEELARVLFVDGYQNIRLFPGGWRDWSLAFPPSEESDEP